MFFDFIFISQTNIISNEDERSRVWRIDYPT